MLAIICRVWFGMVLLLVIFATAAMSNLYFNEPSRWKIFAENAFTLKTFFGPFVGSTASQVDTRPKVRVYLYVAETHHKWVYKGYFFTTNPDNPPEVREKVILATLFEKDGLLFQSCTETSSSMLLVCPRKLEGLHIDNSWLEGVRKE